MRLGRDRDNGIPGLQSGFDETSEANYKGCIIRIEFNLVAARDLHSSQCKWWERLIGVVESFRIRRGGEIVTR